MKCNPSLKICFQLTCMVILIITGCKKVTTDIEPTITLQSTNKINPETFSYEVQVYDSLGQFFVYKCKSLKPITKLDSSGYRMDELNDTTNKTPGIYMFNVTWDSNHQYIIKERVLK